MTKQDAIKWLFNLKMDIGKTQHQELWHYEQAIDEIIEMLEQEPCEDCISREWLLNELNNKGVEYRADINEIILKAPSVVPKRGKWIDRASELDAGLGRHNFVCSECAHTAWYFVGGSEDWWDIRKPNYCPNCGADMRE